MPNVLTEAAENDFNRVFPVKAFFLFPPVQYA